ncbi:class I SAM-dependent methyltransferase [Pelagovum pacificum]|uniref:Methyltransferase domain-containing protein n=1 Tax=Pelagovum pacificum TaxID=2588711 RepID=A0A5C5G7B0_9RHOB|nr:class I SAM-dependent methyltransferase [Pelagovum pacificum]QQA45070.1 methyltransferase domain-containing protein [Pelagovum pacificum]TNY30556.1 methyltransferase domain-containing protein [Pelagovum pacificum]
MTNNPYLFSPNRTARLRKVIKEVEGNDQSLNTAVTERAKTLIKSRLHKGTYELSTDASRPDGRLVCIGPGGAFHQAWTTVDKTYGDASWAAHRRGAEATNLPDIVWDAYDLDPIPLPRGETEAIVCQHVIEHLTEPATHHLLTEAHRLLQDGGVLRLSSPDANLFFDAYDREDWAFFWEHDIIYAETASPELFRQMEETDRREYAAYSMLSKMSLVTLDENPTTVSYGDCAAFVAEAGGAQAAVTKACAASDADLNRSLGRHITWWSVDRLREAMRRAGFTDIRRSAYLQSQSPLMRNAFFFDRTDPHQTVFVEACKPAE